MDRPIQIELFLEGDPQHFAAVAERPLAPDLPRLQFRKDAGKVTATLSMPGPKERVLWRLKTGYKTRTYEREQRVYHRATVEAIALPGNRTLLTIRATDEDWAHVEPIWLALVAELERLGFLDTSTPGDERVESNSSKASGISIASLLPTEEERQKAYAPDATVQDIERLPLQEVERLAKGGGPSAQNAQKVLDALQSSLLNIFAAAAGMEPLSSLEEEPRIRTAIADHISTFGGIPDDPKWRDYPLEYLREQAEFAREVRARNPQNTELETALQVLSHLQATFGPSLLSKFRLHSSEQVPTSETATSDLIQSAWKENGRPIEPARFRELVEQRVIDPKTNEGAAITLEWAKEYQQVKGRQAFNITRDIELLAGDGYQTLNARARKFKRKL